MNETVASADSRETSHPALDTASGSTSGRAQNRLWPMVGLVTLPLVGLDQLTKLYIASHFPLYRSVPIIPNWIDLTYTLNPGAAFSLFATMPAAVRRFFFVGLSFAAIIVLLVMLTRHTTRGWSAFAFALILGGTIGNLIDRLARGRVIDFIYFHHYSFSYPVFNLADSAITVGVAIILIIGFATGPAPDEHQAGHGR
jgi:signal peptidase II